jgi:hypothetical protein
MSGKKIFYLFTCLLFSVALNSQSLLQDTEKLLSALDVINNQDKEKAKLNTNAAKIIFGVLKNFKSDVPADSLANALTGEDLFTQLSEDTSIVKILQLDTSILNPAQSFVYDSSDFSAIKSKLQNLKIEELLELTRHQITLSIRDASAQALAILYSYSRPLPGDTMRVGTWEALLAHYNENGLFKGLLNVESFGLTDSISSEFSDKVQFYIGQVTEGPRQKILELLNAGNAISPADYLSVSKTLEEYTIPPVTQAMALRSAGQETAVNKNVKQGFFVAEAEIIKGMFEFVLDRAKDEVVINFLDRLVNEETPNFGFLFPTVVDQFHNQDFTLSTSYVERIRQAFYQDFQKLSVRLPLLMLEDDYFKPLQGNPIAYDILSIYSMIGMSQQGATIDEIFPVTHRFLYKGFTDSSKETNFALANKATGDLEYQKLISLSEDIKEQLKEIYSGLAAEEESIIEQVDNGEVEFSRTDGPISIEYLDNPDYSLKTLIGEDNGNVEFDLFLLPSLLTGELDYDYVLGFNTFEGYDKFFKDKKTTTQWRAAGLELLRKLSGTWYNDKSIADILYNWQSDLVQYKRAVDSWEQMIDTGDALKKAKDAIKSNTEDLIQTIQATKEFWETNGGLTENQKLEFDLLRELVSPSAFRLIDRDPKYTKMRALERDPVKKEALKKKIVQLKLDRKIQQLDGVQERLTIFDKELRDELPDFFLPSPLKLYITNEDMVSTPLGYITTQIDTLAGLLVSLDKQLQVVDSKFASVESRARDNAKPILQTTELMTQLLYGLRTDSNEEGKRWITKDQLGQVLDGKVRQNIFLGLLTQRLSGIKQIGKFSPDGLAQLIQLSIADLNNLPAFNEVDSLGQQKDSLAFFHKAAFAVNTLNRILELPLVVEPNNPGTFKPLKEQWPGLKEVPSISKQALNFIYYLNVKEHGQAVSSLIRLFTSLDTQTPFAAVDTMSLKGRKDYLDSLIGPNKLSLNEKKAHLDSLIGKRQAAIQFLKQYGNFVADLIDAKSDNQVKDLLDNIADPPGSSRTKRRKDITVGINAFLGATVGGEQWSGDALTGDDEKYFANVAPSMPFGFAVSGLLGKHTEKPQSFSLFLSLLDLGGLFSYRADPSAIGDDGINFKNVFKPGLQVQWNLRKSPFYLSAGGHFGPHFRTLNDEVVSFNSKRFFIGFGIDVPVFTLYTK